jgi:hypothetical protein
VRGGLFYGKGDGLHLSPPVSMIDLQSNRPYVYANVINRNLREMFTAHNNKNRRHPAWRKRPT